MPAQAAGGPYQLVFSAAEHIVLQDVWVGEPRALCYAFSDAPAVNLTNSAGLPAEPFRWPLGE